MSSIKGTPAYWKRFFLILSCANLRGNELISIIYKLNGVDVVDKGINRMSYHWCDKYKNPVLVTRHFQYRIEIFFKVNILDGLLGKAQYYEIRLEFQVRGRPHIHSFIWILNLPKLTKHNIDEYTKLVDSTVRADLPDATMSLYFLSL